MKKIIISLSVLASSFVASQGIEVNTSPQKIDGGIHIPYRNRGNRSSAIQIGVGNGSSYDSYNAIRGIVESSGKQIGGIEFFPEEWMGRDISKSAGTLNLSGFNGVTVGGWDRPLIKTFFRSSDGFVGIGTADPKAKLDVNGGARVHGTLHSNYLIIDPQHNDFEGGELILKGAGSYPDVYIDNIGGALRVFGGGSEKFILRSNGNLNYRGNIGIGVDNPDEKLTVNGKIHAREVRVDLNIPADYVFQKYFTGSSVLKPEYSMPTLSEVEQFIKKNHHLPEMPSAKEIQEKGLHLGEMNNLLLQKVEELTLYSIEQEKDIQTLSRKNKELQEEVNKLKSLEKRLEALESKLSKENLL